MLAVGKEDRLGDNSFTRFSNYCIVTLVKTSEDACSF